MPKPRSAGPLDRYGRFGEEIRLLRKSKGLNQAALAELLSTNLADGGIHRDTVGAWERGGAFPSSPNLSALMRVLGFGHEDVYVWTKGSADDVEGGGQNDLAIGSRASKSADALSVLHHARDVLVATKDHARFGVDVRLRCILIGRTRSKAALFLDIQDDTGQIQAVLAQSVDNLDEWKAAVEYRVGNSLDIIGKTSGKYSAAIVEITRLSAISVGEPVAERGRRSVGLGSPITQAYVARLQRIIRNAFEEDGYVEISTRMISSSAPPSPGLYPLRVLYDGFGAPFYIAPSPAPQLIQTLSSTSYDRVFTISRCFTQGYRDPVVSVESVIIVAATRGQSIRDRLLAADTLIRDLLLRPETRTSQAVSWPTTRLLSFEAVDATSSAAVSSPEIQLFRGIAGGGGPTELGRLCWPRHPELRTQFSEYVIAEGYSVGRADAVAFSVLTINVDRLLTLILEQADLRRIPSLVGPTDHIAREGS